MVKFVAELTVLEAFPARVTALPTMRVIGWPSSVAPMTSSGGTLATLTVTVLVEALVTLTLPRGISAPRPGMISPGNTGCGRQ